MLIEELIDDGTRIHHYSDEGFMIKQIETEILYEDAIDIVPCRYTYEETDEPIPPEPEPPEPPEIPEEFRHLVPTIPSMSNFVEAEFTVDDSEEE